MTSDTKVLQPRKYFHCHHTVIIAVGKRWPRAFCYPRHRRRSPVTWLPVLLAQVRRQLQGQQVQRDAAAHHLPGGRAGGPHRSRGHRGAAGFGDARRHHLLHMQVSQSERCSEILCSCLTGESTDTEHLEEIQSLKLLLLLSSVALWFSITHLLLLRRCTVFW